MADTSTRPSPVSPLELPGIEPGLTREALVEENARLRRICAALIERVESSGQPGTAPYAAFEHTVVLAEQVRERTEALRHTLEALREAKAEAEAANLSKTKFLAAVSHDLLQPLNAARLFTSALESQALAEEPRRLAWHIGRSLQDVETLLGTLVDISRLDAGALTPDRGSFPARELLDVLAEEHRQLAAAEGLDFRYVPSRALIDSDLTLLARMVRNLLGNAIRYTASGRVLLGCRRRAEGLEIWVADSGGGIAEDQQRAIFEEFRRGPAERGRGDRGLGLGLAIVERIAGLLDHPLGLVSYPGRGSRFSIRVPYGRAYPPAPAEVGGEAPLTGLTAWVIDDDPEICAGMAALLAGWGCHAVTATGNEALDRGVAADLLIIDYHLGATDGLAVADRLRRECPSLPVILVTAHHDAELKAQARRRGYGYLLKPVKPLRLKMAMLAMQRR
ncbi:hybrid sensor histidine kinase/response regulator [Halomonas sp. 328]|uniref:hybrid sensor histidine kinase/response regulator n=1 Tax=Halomonas sp. 328 TaxID=2776704 RepID=UPI0018A71FEB|nr:hybrid sensor histidine kinase/response regulator [Halomonas sp. 328]MBF8223105.1 response regulator [Halomonas sp. 328]